MTAHPLCEQRERDDRITPAQEVDHIIPLARDHVPYYLWHQQRFLETTEGNIVHYSHIECHIEALGERFDIHEITFDRWGCDPNEPKP